MDFDTWNPVYAAILADMGYDRSADERARDRLAAIVRGELIADPTGSPFSELTVAVAAPGPSLETSLETVEAADVVIAAGTAADRLLATGVEPAWIVTDLDGHPDRVPAFTNGNATVAVHAHGDNRELVDRIVPDCAFASLLPTTQAAPVWPVRNFGGFTDGDRAAFLADELGARRLTFPGWDLDDTDVDAEKRAKLRWAARLLAWLEVRRDERFDVLDGVRNRLDTSAIPGLS
jgi:uncharacterized Rossmann fold enzyme